MTRFPPGRVGTPVPTGRLQFAGVRVGTGCPPYPSFNA